MAPTNNMGFTLQQLQAQGAQPVPPQQSAANAAFQAFGTPSTPQYKSPQGAAGLASVDAGMQGVKQGTAANLPSSIVPAVRQVGSEVKNDVVQPLSDAMQGKQSGFSAGLQGVGNLLNTAVVKPGNEVLAPISNAWQGLTKILNPVVDTLSGQAQGSTEQSQQQAAQQAAAAYAQFSQAHPEAAKNLEALGNIGQAGMAAAGTDSLIDGAKAGYDRVAPIVTDAANSAASSIAEAFKAPPVETPAVTDSANIAEQAMSTPLSETERANLARQGKVSIENGKAVYGNDFRDTKAIEALTPMVEDGRVVAPKNIDSQVKNLNAVQGELDTARAHVQGQLAEADKANPIKDPRAFKNDMVKEVLNTKQPLGIKPLENHIERFQNSVYSLIDQMDASRLGAKTLLEKFDGMVKEEYPNLYEKDMSPMRRYVQNLRESVYNVIGKYLKDGKLPDGTDFRAELKRQSSLIDAHRGMAELFGKSYTENSGDIAKFFKDNPSAKFMLRRIGFSLAGIGAAGYTFRKAVSGLFSGK